MGVYTPLRKEKPMPPVPTCNHVRTSGTLCGSPSLKGCHYCYFHQRDRQRQDNLRQARTVKLSTKTPGRDDMDAEILESLALPVLEDANAIQVAMTTVLRAFASNHIRPRRAGILVYGLAVAASNLPRLRLNLYGTDSIASSDPEPIEPLVPFEPVPQPSLVAAAYGYPSTPTADMDELPIDDPGEEPLAAESAPATRNSVLGTRNSPQASSAASAGRPAGAAAAAPPPLSSESNTPARIKKAPRAARAPRRSPSTRYDVSQAKTDSSEKINAV